MVFVRQVRNEYLESLFSGITQFDNKLWQSLDFQFHSPLRVSNLNYMRIYDLTMYVCDAHPKFKCKLGSQYNLMSFGVSWLGSRCSIVLFFYYYFIIIILLLFFEIRLQAQLNLLSQKTPNAEAPTQLHPMRATHKICCYDLATHSPKPYTSNSLS